MRLIVVVGLLIVSVFTLLLLLSQDGQTVQATSTEHSFDYVASKEMQSTYVVYQKESESIPLDPESCRQRILKMKQLAALEQVKDDKKEPKEDKPLFALSLRDY